jgi:hypothetical protein
VIAFYRRTMRKLMPDYGFAGGRYGFHGGRTHRFGARDAARYLAPYLSPDDGSLAEAVADMQRVAGKREDRTRRSFRPVYVSPRLTKATGCTMAFLRFKRWVYAVWRNGLADAMTPGEWRRRPPPARFTHTQRLNLTMALHELRWGRLAGLDAGGQIDLVARYA